MVPTERDCGGSPKRANPAVRSEERARGVIETLPERIGTLLLNRISGYCVMQRWNHGSREPDVWTCGVKGLRIAQGPDDDLVRVAVDVIEHGVRADEVVGAALRAVEHLAGRERGPQGESRLAVAHAPRRLGRVEEDDVDAAGAADQSRLRDRIHLRARESILEQRELVGRDVDAVLVGADVRKVGKARSSRAIVIRRAFGAVVHPRDSVYDPFTRRIARLADREVEIVLAREGSCERILVEIDRKVEPPVRVGIVMTADVEREGAEHPGSSVDGRGKSVKLIEREDRRQRRSRAGVVDAQRRIYRLEDVAVPYTKTLIGGLAGELISACGQPAVAMVYSLEAQVNLGVRLGLLA